MTLGICRASWTVPVLAVFVLVFVSDSFGQCQNGVCSQPATVVSSQAVPVVVGDVIGSTTCAGTTCSGTTCTGSVCTYPSTTVVKENVVIGSGPVSVGKKAVLGPPLPPGAVLISERVVSRTEGTPTTLPATPVSSGCADGNCPNLR